MATPIGALPLPVTLGAGDSIGMAGNAQPVGQVELGQRKPIVEPIGPAQKAVNDAFAGFTPEQPLTEWQATAQQAATVPQQAMQAAMQRSGVAAIPGALAGQYGGTYFGPDYESAKASGKFTPQQIAAADAARARYAATPLGLAQQEMELGKREELSRVAQEQAGAGADIAAAQRYNQALSDADKDNRRQMQQFESMRQDFDASQQKRLRDMDELKAEIAATKIDPARYWSQGSGFGQALSLLAVALGGFAQGYSGGRIPNTALDQLNDSINKDIEAQKASLANKRGVLAEAQNIYGIARQKFGDDQSAMDYTRARQNEALKNVALRYENEARTDKLKASAQYLANHFANQEQLYDVKVRQMHADAEARRLQAAAASQFSAQAQAERDFDKQLERRAKIAAVGKTLAETEKLTSEGAFGGLGEKPMQRIVRLGIEANEPVIAPTTQAAEELAIRQAAASKLARITKQMIDIGGSAPLDLTAASKKLSALRSEAGAALARSRAGGKTTEQDEQRALNDIPLPARFFDTGEKNVLDLVTQQGQNAVYDYSKAVNAKNLVETTRETQAGFTPVYQYGNIQGIAPIPFREGVK